VGHREDLRTVLIEQKVVIAEVRAAHVPVEVLRLNVKCKHVGEQFTKLARDLYDRVLTEICGDRRSSLLFHSSVSSCYAFSKAEGCRGSKRSGGFERLTLRQKEQRGCCGR